MGFELFTLPIRINILIEIISYFCSSKIKHLIEIAIKRIYRYFLVCVIIIFIIPKSFSQVKNDSLPRLGKYVFNMSVGFAAMWEDSSYSNTYYFTLHPKFGYFVTPHILPYFGLDLMLGNSKIEFDTSHQNLIALSPGIRFYITKKNIIFFETGIQYGKYTTNYKRPAAENCEIFQAGIGVGINFLLMQNVGYGRLAFEYKFRLNYDFIDRSNKPPLANFNILKSLGSSFGLSYIFPSAKPSYAYDKVKKDQGWIKSNHIIKTDISSFAYTYEQALGKLFAVDFGFQAYNYMALFSEEHFFDPCLRIEPRYYYGFNRRNARGQKTINNSSDFMAFDMSYIWEWQHNKGTVDKMIHLAPKWGMRRTFGKHFVFELQLGAFYEILWDPIETHIGPVMGTTIGYCF